MGIKSLRLLLATCLVVGQVATSYAGENGANTNSVREASGRYSYRTLSDGSERGRESFKLLVHPDGSRTLQFWHDLWAKDAQFTVVLRVAADFQVDGNTLRAMGQGADGLVEQEVEVPQNFSIGTHPVSADGWHLWYADADMDKDQQVINLFSLEATEDAAKPVLGQLVQMPYEIVGAEVVETPAGRFDTMHYRLAGSSDLWVTGPDRILVRMIQERFDREYLLVEYSSSE